MWPWQMVIPGLGLIVSCAEDASLDAVGLYRGADSLPFILSESVEKQNDDIGSTLRKHGNFCRPLLSLQSLLVLFLKPHPTEFGGIVVYSVEPQTETLHQAHVGLAP